MKRVRVFCLTLTMISFWFGIVCFFPVFGAEPAVPDPAAVVNGNSISRAELERAFLIYVQRLRSQGRQVAPADEPALRMQVLNDLIGMELIYQESLKKGIAVPAEEVDKVVADIKKRYADPAAFQKVLERMQITEDQMRAQIAHQSVIRAFVDQEIAPKINISDDASKAFYEANPQFFKQPEQVHARHILIKVEPGADEKTKAKAMATILAIKERAISGEDFGELAKTESQGPSAPKGGDLGYFSRGRMVPAFEEVAFQLKIKEISGVVETNFGYHLIQVLDRKEAKTLAFDEVKDRITSNLRNQQIKQQLDENVADLRKSAKVEILLK